MGRASLAAWTLAVLAVSGCSSFPPSMLGDAASDTRDAAVDVGQPGADVMDAAVVTDVVDVLMVTDILPTDAGVDVLPMDTGVDVPPMDAPPVDTGVDVPRVDTGVDVPPVDTGVDVPRVDTGVDVPVDVPPACGAGLSYCAGVCVSLGTSVANCSSCGHGCGVAQTCVGGTCVTSPSCAGTSPQGCGWVAIPGGTYTMGGDASANVDTPAAGTITISGFTLDAYEVTVGRFRQFWNAGHPAPVTGTIAYPSGSVTWGGPVPITEPEPSTSTACTWSEIAGMFEAHPLNCVDWYTAQAFCAWDEGRLPTEAEWEYAARGWAVGPLSPERRYPWGPTDPSTTCDRAQWNSCPGDDGLQTRRVGSFASSGGVYDLAGNVWEWNGDWYALYTDTTCWNGIDRTNPYCNNNATGQYSVRGGTWSDVAIANLRSASRGLSAPAFRGSGIGFRCAHPPICGAVGQPCCGGPSGTCSAAGSVCTLGTCGCPTGTTACGNACTVLATDANNCSACGTVCAAGMTCTGGTCVPPPSCPVASERGCGFVAIPGGTFTMGGDTGANNDTPAAGTISVSDFTLDAYEVTVARFRRFWTASPVPHPAPSTGAIAYPGSSVVWGGPVPVVEPFSTSTTNCTWNESAGPLEAHPINCVDWYAAQAFCVWDGGRLPTEAEWEYAARGWAVGGLASGRNYPWGPPDPTGVCDRAQWNNCAGDDGTATRQVGRFTGSAGLFDLAGNVWEWAGDWYEPYTDTLCWNGVSRSNPICGDAAMSDHPVRGGGYDETTVAYFHSATRSQNSPLTRQNDIGFRCARAH